MKNIFYFFFLFTATTTAQTVTTISESSGITDALVFDAEGHLIGSDYYNGKIFKTTLPDGMSSLFAEGFRTANGLVYDDDGVLYMADNLGNKIYKIFPSGTSEVFVNFINPSSLIFELDSDTLIAASYAQKKIVKIAPDGTITNWSSGGQLFGGPNGFVYDDDDNFYVCNFDDRRITQILPDGSQIPLAQAPGGGAMGGITYANGYIYGSLITTNKIFRTDLDGNGVLYLGSSAGTVDSDASEAKFNGPNGILASATGDTIYVSDLNTSNVRMITGINITVSVDEVDSGFTTVKLIPNPAVNNAQISLEVARPTTASMELRDLSGKMVMPIISLKKLQKGVHHFDIQTSKLASGSYFIFIQNEEGYVLSKRIIIE